MRLVLASKSKARISMLENAGFDFEFCPAEIDEESMQNGGLPARAIACVLARAKACNVSEKFPDALVIGSDQVMEFEDCAVFKAKSEDEALGRLKQMRGKEHKLISAVSLCQGGEEIWSFCDEVILKMADFDDAFLRAYSERAGSVLLDTVGGYELEGAGVVLFDEIDGDFFTVLGMPLLALVKRLRQEEGLLL